MARTTKPGEILGAVRQRLIDSQVFTAANCSIAQPEQVWDAPPAQVWANIWFEGGQFDPQQIDGGMPTIKASIVIAIFTQIKVDKVGEDEKTATDDERGLLPMSDRVFQSLWLHDLVDFDAVSLLAEPMRPLGVSRPDRIRGEPGAISMAWEVVFEWEVDE